MGEKLRDDGRVEGRIRNQENKKETKNRPKSSFWWSLFNFIWRIPPGILKYKKGKKKKPKHACQVDTRADFLVTNFIIVDRDRERKTQGRSEEQQQQQQQKINNKIKGTRLILMRGHVSLSRGNDVDNNNKQHRNWKMNPNFFCLLLARKNKRARKKNISCISAVAWSSSSNFSVGSHLKNKFTVFCVVYFLYILDAQQRKKCDANPICGCQRHPPLDVRSQLIIYTAPRVVVCPVTP